MLTLCCLFVSYPHIFSLPLPTISLALILSVTALEVADEYRNRLLVWHPAAGGVLVDLARRWVVSWRSWAAGSHWRYSPWDGRPAL